MDTSTDKRDELIRFLLPQAQTRGAMIRGQHIFHEACRIHGLSGPIAELFGQSLLASVLLLSVNKGGVRQVLQLDAMPELIQTPIERMLAETSNGEVRGYISWREGSAAMQHGDGHNLSDWMGRPIRLSTVRDLGIGQPYISTIENDSDYLADHLVHYLQQSVQTRADIVIAGDLAILIEAMPGCEDELWFDAVKALASIPNEKLLTDTTEQLLGNFSGLGCQQVESDFYAYRCPCTAEKMKQAIESIPVESILELADENGKVRISCQYCDKFYEVDAPAS